MPSTECQCAMITQTAEAGPGLQVCHHFANSELDPIIQTLNLVIDQFDVGINPEFVLETPLRDQLEAYFRDVWDTARQLTIDNDEPDPGNYNPEFLDANIRLVLTISFMRHMAIISQLLMAVIVQHLNDTNPQPADDTDPQPADDTDPQPADEPTPVDAETPPGQPPDTPPEPDTSAADAETETPAAADKEDQPASEPTPPPTAADENMPNMPTATNTEPEYDSPPAKPEENA